MVSGEKTEEREREEEEKGKGMWGTRSGVSGNCWVISPLLVSQSNRKAKAERERMGIGRIRMRDRSKNRKPLQRGRNLSIEAIQAVQALKRAKSMNINGSFSIGQVLDSKFRRLLKFDMMAVLRELLRQNECLLALTVFEDIRKEQWYKPQVSLYADIIVVLASNGLLQQVELLYLSLKRESSLDPEIEGFNALLKTFMSFHLTSILMDCYNLMKDVGCEPERSSFKILINGLESIGETGTSSILRKDAQKYYGESLDFLKDEEEIKG